MKKFFSVILSALLVCSSLFAQSPIFGVWSESWFRWSRHSYAITNEDFKYRDESIKVQTRYPYRIEGNYIVLYEPEHYLPESPRMPDKKFSFERNGDVLTFHLSTGDVTCVLNERINETKKKLVIAGGICVVTGVVLYAGGKIIDYRKCAASGEAFSESTTSYANFSKGIIHPNGYFKPNIKYKSCGYSYQTDSSGRIANWSGKLRLEDGKRNKTAQLAAGGVDRLPGDQGGHLIGSQFGGSGTSENLVAMAQTVNQGSYKKLENLWASALSAGKSVYVNGAAQYVGTSERPTKFIIEYIIDGEKNKSTIFNN